MIEGMEVVEEGRANLIGACCGLRIDQMVRKSPDVEGEKDDEFELLQDQVVHWL